MTTDQKKEIIAYLSGPRNYDEGVVLYRQYGLNLRLKREFAVNDTFMYREILVDELRKLAGLSEAEFSRLPRLAKSESKKEKPVATQKAEPKPQADDETTLVELADSFGVTVDELVSPDFQERVLAMEENEDKIEELTEQLEEARSKYAEAPEPMRKMIRFREKYPFLNSPDCPDILKILVADMFTAYGNFKTAHARLQTLGDDDSATAAADCETVVNEYLANREIWDELEYYRINGTILGKAAKFREIEAAEDLAALSDVDLMKKLASARANVSKQKKAAADAIDADADKVAANLKKWLDTKSALEAEVERRKKK